MQRWYIRELLKTNLLYFTKIFYWMRRHEGGIRYGSKRSESFFFPNGHESAMRGLYWPDPEKQRPQPYFKLKLKAGMLPGAFYFDYSDKIKQGE